MAKRKRIINLTTHRARPDQKAAGVVDLDKPGLEELWRLLEFEELPTAEVIRDRARAIVRLAVREAARDCRDAMIGGPPFLMSELAYVLDTVGIDACFDFTKYEVEETVQPDGGVKKVCRFRHIGFVPA